MSYTVSASDVKQLRELTGAGMMDCKKALIEAEGDIEKAIENLRKKGQKISAKRAARQAKEGAVIAIVNPDKSRGVVIRLSCETDFVAKNEDFVQMARNIAQIALEHFPESKEALLNLPYDDHLTVGEKITEQVGVIGEKIELVDYRFIEAPVVSDYIHMGNKAGVIVCLNKAVEGAYEAGRNVAMQVAAMKPIAVDEADVDQAIIDKEMEIGMEQARREGKPEHLLENIAKGKVKKFLKENTLLNQVYVRDGKITVRQYLQSIDPELTVTGFEHLMLG